VSVRITDSRPAALYCSTSMQAFGPMFEDSFDADEFLEWLDTDARKLTAKQLDKKYAEWMAQKEDD
jgi:hypothetical protein